MKAYGNVNHKLLQLKKNYKHIWKQQAVLLRFYYSLINGLVTNNFLVYNIKYIHVCGRTQMGKIGFWYYLKFQES